MALCSPVRPSLLTPVRLGCVSGGDALIHCGKLRHIQPLRFLESARAVSPLPFASPTILGKTLPSTCGSTAFAAKTLPLPRVSAAFAAKTLSFLV